MLKGGNPQIAKADGDSPIREYIAAMPAWKRSIGQRLDALICECVPTVQKAVKWNSPMYGLKGRGWFVSFHVFTNYVKVSFFKGSELKLPPQACPLTIHRAPTVYVACTDIDGPHFVLQAVPAVCASAIVAFVSSRDGRRPGVGAGACTWKPGRV